MSEQLVYTLETNRFHEGCTDHLVIALPGGVAPTGTFMLFLEVGEGAWKMEDAVAYAITVDFCVYIIRPDDLVYHQEVFWPAFRCIGNSSIRPLQDPEGYLRTMDPLEKLALLEAHFVQLFLEWSSPAPFGDEADDFTPDPPLDKDDDYLMPVESC